MQGYPKDPTRKSEKVERLLAKGIIVRTFNLRTLCSAVVLSVLSVSLHADSVFVSGRALPASRDGRVNVTAGTVSDIYALVQETTRAYYEVTGQPEKQALADTYDTEDFGMNDSYPTVGLSAEWIWSYFTLQMDMLLMNPDANAVAQENYYIGVGEPIEFEGKSYDNLKIPKGQEFSSEFLGGSAEVRGLITPFSFRPSESLCITPWIDLSVLMFGGQYKIDAGEPTGTTQYLYPPEEFVVGGRSEGLVGLALPEYGLGGEIRIGDGTGPVLTLMGNYALCNFSGSTKYILVSGHHVKDIDIDHTNVRGRCLLEIPMESGRSWLLGVQYQHIESDALIESQEATPEEIIERRERFDKHVEFQMSSLTGMVGLTF